MSWTLSHTTHPLDQAVTKQSPAWTRSGIRRWTSEVYTTTGLEGHRVEPRPAASPRRRNEGDLGKEVIWEAAVPTSGETPRATERGDPPSAGFRPVVSSSSQAVEKGTKITGNEWPAETRTETEPVPYVYLTSPGFSSLLDASFPAPSTPHFPG